MIQVYRDGIVEEHDFFTRQFKGYSVRGAIFRADILQQGQIRRLRREKPADNPPGPVSLGPRGDHARHVLHGRPERNVPDVQRKDIAILSVGNSEDINRAFEGCEHLLVKETADYQADFHSFVRKSKMWCGKIEYEPDFEALGITEDAGSVLVEDLRGQPGSPPRGSNPSRRIFRLLQQ